MSFQVRVAGLGFLVAASFAVAADKPKQPRPPLQRRFSRQRKSWI